MPEAPRKTKIPTSHGYGGQFTNCTRKGSMSFKDVLTGDRGMDKAIKKTLVLDDKWSGFENLHDRSLVLRAASFEVLKNIKTFVVHKAQHATDDAEVSYYYVGLAVNDGRPILGEVSMTWRKKTFMVWVSEDGGDWEPDFLRSGKKETHASTEEEDRTEPGSRVATNASPEIGQDDGIVSPEKDMEGINSMGNLESNNERDLNVDCHFSNLEEFPLSQEGGPSVVTTRGGKENAVGLVDFNDLKAEDHLASDNEVENNYEMGLNNSRRIESNGETHITPSGESTDVSWDLNCKPALVGDRAQSKEERPVHPDISQSSRSVGSE
ncbi:hypothetical protein L1987_42696 [Smallanthus sonchifolius]|uniref:Uncharacterized protein n=1 Tax=Smallanthus sonchifolius TaxID=185202 RepID=A0ACB9GLL1_9ASTR|nr:hypothetical protein L1987_42696 [Smallanthus sonchifolius]